MHHASLPTARSSVCAPMNRAFLASLGLYLALGHAAITAAAPAATSCLDTPTPGGFTCQQQKSWNKCNEQWMVQGGWCAATCSRCDAGSANSAASASNATSDTTSSPPPPSPSPQPSATNASPPGSLSGNVAEYGKVLNMSWLFYYAQRSGKLSDEYNPIPWRGDSHLDDRAPGGFHDAGDHLKLNFPLATSLTFLSWGLLEFPDAYSAIQSTKAALDNIRWGADYLMACHIGDNQYIAQIGDPGPDHAYWGRPEDQTGSRPAFVWDKSKPASDAAGAAASALAAASLVFKSSDAEYAGACLDHARRLFSFASQHEGKYSDSIPSVTYVYMSTNFLDDLAFAAAWLYRATKEDSYLTSARSYLQRAQYSRNYFISWDSVFTPSDILLSSLGVGPSPGVDHAWQIQAFLSTWLKGQNGVSFSPKGLAVAPLGGWGNLRHAANAAFMMVLHAKATDDAGNRTACLDWASKQIDYMLGLRGSDRSYVVGYGNNPPTHAHHRAASCPNRPSPCTYESAFNSPAANPQVLSGALVGGPPSGDKYEDSRQNFQTNEVAVDYNAGFTGALAGLVQLLSAPAVSDN